MSLHVLQIVESRDHDAGSAFISISGLATQLNRSGIQASVISDDGPTNEAEVRRAVESTDVVHIHGWDHAMAHAAASFATTVGTPYVVSPLGGFNQNDRTSLGRIKRWRWRRRDSRLLRDCKRVLPINNHELLECQRCVPRVPSEVLPYGLDVGDYQNGRGENESPADPDRRKMLILAPIHPREGSVAFLKSLAELGRSADEWTVTLAGREVGEYRKMLEAALRRKGVESRVSFTSAIDEDTQRNHLARTDVLVCPSLRARCPVSLLQGLAAGTPTLATQALAPEGAADALKCCAPTPLGLRDATAAVVELTDVQRREMGTKALAWFKSNLDWQALAPRYVKMYGDLASA